jgi:FG-GAP repeat
VRLHTWALAGWISSCTACSYLVSFDGYVAASSPAEDTDAGAPDAASPLPLAPAVARFKSFRFQRGPTSLSVEPATGLLAGAATEELAVVAGSFATSAGGGIELDAQGGFSYVPPGAAGAFWGDDYFEYAFASTPTSKARVRLTVQPDVIRLAELAASSGAGFGIAGAAPLDQLGGNYTGIIDARHTFFSPAGDVNGDGNEDFVLGVLGPALPNSGIPYAEGRGAYVLFGKQAAAANVSLADLAGEPPRGFAILDDDNDNVNDSLGYAVAGAGDVNGDHLDDIIVSSHSYDPNCTPELPDCNGWGAAYVVFGKADSEPVQCADLRAGKGGGFAILPPTDDSYGLVGFAVAGAGDVNGDGLADVLVDVPLLVTGIDPVNDVPQLTSVPHVIFGKVGPAPVRLEDVTAGIDGGFAIFGDDADQSLGNHLAGIGDVNGDGLADVAVSSEYFPDSARLQGRIAVVFGKMDETPVRLTELEMSSERGFFIVGADDGDMAGAPAYGGDFNGDGLDDIVVGVPWASVGHPPEPTLGDAGASSPDAGSTLDGGGCASLSCLGSDPDPEPVTEEGAVYVVFGTRQPTNVSLREIEDRSSGGLVFVGNSRGQNFGYAVTSGDLDGDGLSDIIAAGPPSATYNEGRIIFGKPGPGEPARGTGQAAPSALTLICEGPERACGMLVSGADATGDGIDDLLVSSELYPNAPQLAGGAYLLFGWDMSGSLADRDRALLGKSKDDLLELPEAPVVIARGGHGRDTLRLAGHTARLDLTLPGRYESLEVIDLSGGGPQELVLDDAALRRIPENQPGQTFGLVRRLTVIGDAEDTLRFDRTGYTLRGPNGDRDVWGRDGAYYGLEVSRAMPIVWP